MKDTYRNSYARTYSCCCAPQRVFGIQVKMWLETHIYIRKETCTLEKRPTQKMCGPTYSKAHLLLRAIQTFVYTKRDLHKKPVERHSRGHARCCKCSNILAAARRNWRVEHTWTCHKRPICTKRDLYVRKETYMYEKRLACTNRNMTNGAVEYCSYHARDGAQQQVSCIHVMLRV